MLSSFAVSPDQGRTKTEGVTPGERVRRARVRARLSQKDLAREVGCTRNTIANIEGDKTRRRSTVEAVAQVLKTTPEALGYRFSSPIRVRNLNERQRALVDEVLSLSDEEQERVFAVLAGIRAKRRKGGDE